MTTIFKTEVEAFVVLYARCNDIAELLSDEAHMMVAGSLRRQSWVLREAGRSPASKATPEHVGGLRLDVQHPRTLTMVKCVAARIGYVRNARAEAKSSKMAKESQEAFRRC